MERGNGELGRQTGKRQVRVKARIRSVNQAIIALQVPFPTKIKRPRHAQFFNWPSPVVWVILELCHINYRKLCRRYHPDKGGNRLRFERVITAWRLLSRQAAKHGYELG